MEFVIFLKDFLWSFSNENAESCHLGILYGIIRLPHEVRVEHDHELQVHNILFIQIRGYVASPRCRAIGYVSRGWVGLPPDFHWAENSDEPQSSQFSQQRLREFLTIECSRSVHSIVDLSLLSVAQRKIFRKPHPIPAYVTLCTAAWILVRPRYITWSFIPRIFSIKCILWQIFLESLLLLNVHNKSAFRELWTSIKFFPCFFSFFRHS